MNPWDEDLAEYVNPWDEDLAADEQLSKTKSGAATKKLQNISLYRPESIGPALLGIAEATAGVGTGLIGHLTSGYAGILGGIAGMVPGGESPGEKAGKWQANTQEAMTYQPRSTQGQEQLADVGEIVGMTEKPFRFAGSGYAALGALPGGVEEAALAQGDFMAEESPLREGVFQVTGSPAAVAVTSMLPELAAMGFVKPPKTPPGPRYPQTVDLPDGYGNLTGSGPAPASSPGTGWRKLQDDTRPSGEFDDLREALQAKDAEKVAELINANPAIVAAFEELGIEYAPQMVSDSAAVRATASGMKTAPGSQLSQVDESVKSALTQRVDEFVNRYGTTNRNAVDDEVRAQFDRDIAELDQLAEQAFEKVNKGVPAGERIDASRAYDYIDKRISDLGGGDYQEGLANASRHEKALWNLTHRERVRKQVDEASGESRTETEWEQHDPSYAAIDAYRKEVGQGINKEGRFKDGEQGELKLTYGLVADAQQQAANRFGFGEEYKAANKLVSERKDIESSSVKVLGRETERGMIQAIDSAAVGIAKGDANGFRRLMKNTPEAQRPMVAMAVINNLFQPGTQKGVGIGKGFLQSVEALNRYPTIKDELFAHLPPSARREFDTIAEAARGFFRSLEKDNNSNTALGRNVNEAINNGTLWTRMFAGLSKNSPIGRDWIASILKDGPSKRSKAASDFVMSDDLNRAVREYAAGRDRRAIEILERSKAQRIWRNTLDAAVKDEIDRIGITAFLFTSQVEDN